MAQYNHDPEWLIFHDHEVEARRATMRLVDGEKDVGLEWGRLRTMRSDYVECLNDIAVTREVSEETYQRAEALYVSEKDAIPWSNDRIAILQYAVWSEEDLLRDLEQFRAMQERKRRNGVMAASFPSREWTKDQVQLITARIDRLSNIIVEVSPAVRGNEDEDSSSMSSRHTDDDNLPSGPSSHGDDGSEFETRWNLFINDVGLAEQDEWIDLYEQARKLWKAGGPSEYPNEDDDNVLQEFKDRINQPLETMVGRVWQSHIDKVNVNEDGGTHRGVDMRVALQLAREGAMRRARHGRTDIWPLPRRTRPRMTAAEAAAKLGFGRDLPGMEGRQWAYFTMIGSGAQGEISLWLSHRPDGNGNVVDRVAVKESHLDPDYETAQRNWIENTPGGSLLSLREPAMHLLLGRDESSRTIVRFRGSKLWPDYLLSRIYMEYSPHGDLGSLFCKHAKVDWDGSLIMDENDQRMEPIRIPRQALWSFFEDLAEAACKMRYGHNPLDPASIEKDDWQTILHRDLKPQNIFLSLPRTPGERGVPELKVGDFGLAVPHDYRGMLNPRDMVKEGTLGWRAPEYNKVARRFFPPILRLSSATDIWAIGRIMLCLVELERPRPLEVWYSEPHNARIWYAKGKEERIEFYGSKLYELIEHCLMPQPDERIYARDLLQSIRAYLDGGHGGRPPLLEEDDTLEYASDMRWAV